MAYKIRMPLGYGKGNGRLFFWGLMLFMALALGACRDGDDGGGGGGGELTVNGPAASGSVAFGGFVQYFFNATAGTTYTVTLTPAAAIPTWAYARSRPAVSASLPTSVSQ